MASSQEPEANVFSVRIVSLDYYMSPPVPGFGVSYSEFQGQSVIEVPVIRIYGPTISGKKTCLHIHGALPYLYVPCEDAFSQSFQEGHPYTHIFASAVEKALRLGNSYGSKRQHVHSCDIVTAKRFYGYYSNAEAFMKIYLYYPHEISRLASLLLGGTILNRCFQPHESHIPYPLQFMVDNNLYGMGHIHLSRVKFRNPFPGDFSPMANDHLKKSGNCAGPEVEHISSASSPGACVSSTVPCDWIWDSPLEGVDVLSDCHTIQPKRQSLCELECDVVVDEILNKNYVVNMPFSQGNPDIKMVQSLVSIWEEEKARSGVDFVLMSDNGRIPPEDVLRSFSPNLDYHDSFLQLHGALGSSIPHKDYLEMGKALRPCDIRSAAPVSEGHDGKLLELENGTGAGVKLTNEEFCSQFGDVEALGLLKWLASSQAKEDIDSDDELVPETVLSPLLPAATVNEVLEKAYSEYEIESQQECQDILDSVEDPLNFKGFELQRDVPDHPLNYVDSASQHMIPQLDGACDEDTLKYSSQDVLEGDGSSSGRNSLEDTNVEGVSSPTSRSGSGGSSWCSLPLSTVGSSPRNPVPNHGVSQGFSGDQLKQVGIALSSNRSGDQNISRIGLDTEFPIGNVNSPEFSLRELMRKKRSHYSVLLEHELGRSYDTDEGLCKYSGSSSEDCQKDRDMRKNRVSSSSAPLFLAPSTTCQPTSIAKSERETKRTKHKISGGKIDRYGTLPLGDLAKMETSSNTLGDCSYDVNDRASNWDDMKRIPSMNNQSMCDGGSLDLQGTISARERKPNDSCQSGVSRGEQTSELGTLDVGTQAGQLQPYIPQPDKHGAMKDLLTDDSHSNRSPLISENLLAPQKLEVVPHPFLDMYPESCAYPKPVKEFKDLEANNILAHSGTELRNQSSEVITEDLIFTFAKKPPTLEKLKQCFGSDFKSGGNHGGFSHCGGIHYGTMGLDFGADSNVERMLPFFMEKESERENPCINDTKLSQPPLSEAIIGVPTHCANDGSLLFMLTPAFSPPSIASVCKWLHMPVQEKHETGIQKEILLGITSQPERVLSGPEDIASKALYINGSNQPLPPEAINTCFESFEAENKGFLSAAVKHVPNEQIDESERSSFENQGVFSQISGPVGRSKLTPLSQIGFRDPATYGGGQQLTLLSIEILAESRGDLQPDPHHDAVVIIALAVQDTNDTVDAIILVHDSSNGYKERDINGLSQCRIVVCAEERCMFEHFVNLVRSLDPDMFLGWEIQGGSLGFLAERAVFLQINLLKNLSRMPSSEIKFASGDRVSENFMSMNMNHDIVADGLASEKRIIEDEWGRTHTSGIHVSGRIVLNLWRILRSELKLTMYTLEAVAESVLRRKVPHISSKILMRWFSSNSRASRFRCIQHVIYRAKLNLEIMNQLDMFNRTSELARVFGIDFFSVLSRGSQYRVESMLLRLVHSQNYLVISPSRQQNIENWQNTSSSYGTSISQSRTLWSLTQANFLVASQPAMEGLPLVMEPESGFYSDPVVVLDFQSLYPSMVIAYNLCFSTCLGKVVPAKPNTLGVCSYKPEPNLLLELGNELLLTPNGVLYMPSKVRRGVLPRLLEEILTTRIMVKQSMKKLEESERILHRILDARQLALKLIANVTYGYTAAGFSGRMPCAELADSIVQCGRRTLEKAISFVNAHNDWNAKVIYGDTDSMFVLLKGCTLEESFAIGQEMATAVTALNPYPVTLKMEKVYYPCFLLTKKRYVGYSYEYPGQIKPKFDAKGIETVRRDTCPAVVKILEESLRSFFASHQLTDVRLYLQRQWTKIMCGKVSLEDFIFAKEVRLGTYTPRVSSLPPAAIVAMKAMRGDPRAEPRYGDRIPYIVVRGEPGARLMDLVVDPLDVLDINSPYTVNDLYYIKKQIIPALQRVFGLVGADLNIWFSETPRPVHSTLAKRYSIPGSGRPRIYKKVNSTRIDNYYASCQCTICGEVVQARNFVCDACSRKKSLVAVCMAGRTSKLERHINHLAGICRHCGGGDWITEAGVKCTSLSCSVFYERRKVQKELQSLSMVAREAGFYPQCMVEWY